MLWSVRSLTESWPQKRRDEYLAKLIERIVQSMGDEPLNERLTSARPKFVAWKTAGPEGRGRLGVVVTCRRLGVDNGMDTLVHLDAKLRTARDQMKAKLFRPPTYPSTVT